MVLVGQPTVAVAGDAIEVEPVDPLELKGKAEPVVAYRLLAVHAVPERRYGTLFVGRERELALVRDALERVQAEWSCELVTVVGEAGVSKSRLVTEALEAVEATVVRGRCLPYGAGITYWPVVEVLRQLDVLPEEDAAAAAIRSLLGESEAATSAEEIAWAFRKTLEDAAVGGRWWLCSTTFSGVRRRSSTWSSTSPCSRAAAPLLLLCLARLELLDSRPSWPAAVRLEPLSSEDATSLIGAAVPEELRARIAAASAGNAGGLRTVKRSTIELEPGRSSAVALGPRPLDVVSAERSATVVAVEDC